MWQVGAADGEELSLAVLVAVPLAAALLAAAALLKFNSRRRARGELEPQGGEAVARRALDEAEAESKPLTPRPRTPKRSASGSEPGAGSGSGSGVELGGARVGSGSRPMGEVAVV